MKKEKEKKKEKKEKKPEPKKIESMDREELSEKKSRLEKSMAGSITGSRNWNRTRKALNKVIILLEQMATGD